jgi:hypothetical protein
MGGDSGVACALSEESIDAMINNIRLSKGKPYALTPRTYMITKLGMEEIIKEVGEEGVSAYLEKNYGNFQLMISAEYFNLLEKGE